MNILIIGSLLVVGIAAVLGAVLLGIGDQRAEAARANSSKQDTAIQAPAPVVPVVSKAPQAPAAPPVAIETKEPAPAVTAVLPRELPTQRKSVLPQMVTETTVTRPSQPLVDRNSFAELDNRLEQPTLNGQFMELANEVRSLHQQAWQLEQRLSVLVEMVDHVERSRSGYLSNEDEEQGQEETLVPSENTPA